MLELLKKNIINFRGLSLKKKFVVIESDDWGSIRIPSQKVAKDLISKGLLN